MTSRQPAPRTQVRRLPGKQVDDRAALDALLANALIAHAAVVDGGQPYVLPVAVAPDGDRVLSHGSTASRLFRALADGAPTCLTVTVVDGLVLARSQFESSMHYRSAVLLGRCSVLTGDDKMRALRVLTEHLMPGRATDARPPSNRELAATTVLALPLDEWSLKVSDAPPEDDPTDLDRPVWAGTVALHHVWGSATPAPDLVGNHPVPAYVGAWPQGRT
ncbi:MAG: pyridoxamine 5'-phosphate oxidase family protein [Rhodoferax sp.]|nr:pyridoxamine 5'-phosphate oxidase family protein [Actinomycetota bacterium]